MDHLPLAQSFVLRIWLEDNSTSSTPLRWRGRITNVLDEQTRFVDSFRQVEEFLEGYMRQWSDEGRRGGDQP
ncbi:MAG: hypothetical protein HKN44_07885 [Ilumatobacter sp.]|nr:hypothetical protein [Ilumatobacter sp.]